MMEIRIHKTFAREFFHFMFQKLEGVKVTPTAIDKDIMVATLHTKNPLDICRVATFLSEKNGTIECKSQ